MDTMSTPQDTSQAVTDDEVSEPENTSQTGTDDESSDSEAESILAPNAKSLLFASLLARGNNKIEFETTTGKQVMFSVEAKDELTEDEAFELSKHVATLVPRLGGFWYKDEFKSIKDELLDYFSMSLKYHNVSVSGIFELNLDMPKAKTFWRKGVELLSYDDSPKREMNPDHLTACIKTVLRGFGVTGTVEIPRTEATPKEAQIILHPGRHKISALLREIDYLICGYRKNFFPPEKVCTFEKGPHAFYPKDENSGEGMVEFGEALLMTGVPLSLAVKLGFDLAKALEYDANFRYRIEPTAERQCPFCCEGCEGVEDLNKHVEDLNVDTKKKLHCVRHKLYVFTRLAKYKFELSKVQDELTTKNLRDAINGLREAYGFTEKQEKRWIDAIKDAIKGVSVDYFKKKGVPEIYAFNSAE